MWVDPAALAPGCNQGAGCPPAAWPINMARETFLLLKSPPFPSGSPCSHGSRRPDNERQAAFAWHVVCVIGFSVHLFASLAAHGWHPAAWRLSGQPGFEGAAPFLRAAKTAERGGLDAVLVGLPPASRAMRTSGKVDRLHPDPLPLTGLLIGATRQSGLCGYWPADVAEPFHVARVFATLDHLSGGRAGWIAGLAGPAEIAGRFQRADLAISDADATARS